MDLLRREEFLNILLNHKDSEQDYISRIRFEINSGDHKAITGALLDYFIFSESSEYDVRRELLKESMHLLDDEWTLFFYDMLGEAVLPETPIPENLMSILTEDVEGTFDFVTNPYK